MTSAQSGADRPAACKRSRGSSIVRDAVAAVSPDQSPDRPAGSTSGAGRRESAAGAESTRGNTDELAEPSYDDDDDDYDDEDDDDTLVAVAVVVVVVIVVAAAVLFGNDSSFVW